MRKFVRNPSDKNTLEYLTCCGIGCDRIRLRAQFRALARLLENETQRADELEKECIHWVSLVELHVFGGHVDWQDELNHYLAAKRQ